MSWSKAEELANITPMLVTPEVSHAPMSWLKAEAKSNIPCMVVTPEVSHAPISSLKDVVVKTQSSYNESLSIQLCRTQNKNDMSVTPEVSHMEMWPYIAAAAVASESHAATAVLMLLSSITQVPCKTPHEVDAHGA